MCLRNCPTDPPGIDGPLLKIWTFSNGNWDLSWALRLWFPYPACFFSLALFSIFSPALGRGVATGLLTWYEVTTVSGDNLRFPNAFVRHFFVSAWCLPITQPVAGSKGPFILHWTKWFRHGCYCFLWFVAQWCFLAQLENFHVELASQRRHVAMTTSTKAPTLILTPTIHLS